MSILSVRGLCKQYRAFRLDQVSFDLEPGKITGFIGRNGAGKTTTLKSILNFVHPDGGEISFFNLPFADNELAIKSRIGFVTGGVDFYARKKLKVITDVTRRFYERWDEAAYRDYLRRFELDENKTPAQLSAGMKVKYALTLALSHHAELLLLDEPTSGLDPVSRDDLLDVFLDLSDRGITILFSTHITTDLDKCADNLIYIRKGRVLAESTLPQFTSQYRSVELTQAQLEQADPAELIGCKRSKNGHCALIPAAAAAAFPGVARPADLETIMVHMEQEGKSC